MDNIKEYNKLIREVLLTVLETFSGVLIAGALVLVFLGTWFSVGSIVGGFFAALATSAVVLVGFAFTFGILFMLMDIRNNTKRTADAMAKLAGLESAKAEVAPQKAESAPKAAPKKKAPTKKTASKK